MKQEMTNVYTISVTNLNTEESVERKESWENYYSFDTAVDTAIEIVQELADDEDIYMVTIFGGEYQDEDGNILGDMFDFLTFSNKDRETTINARLERGYARAEVDGYIVGEEYELYKK